ncbi:sensor histidine kinase [Spirosoma endophyticum]|uniref:histidine kinase n=1 Tax=Spirosoma endophyticum TaxID=662367 RepID=A0A1I1MPQ0_9BACT|nr:HAMP domain-containing sensor histidine kinase [Spirosoma endophyticum]SFC87447.1 Signal transduction histidine kinase [Spirosoma endophyticum]
MGTQAADHQQALDELIAYLFNRRETLLNNWRTTCEADPALKKIAFLSREEFNNLMPTILDSLEQLLRGNKPEISPIVAAQSHGLQRWQKSQELPSLLKEFNHLSVILFDELKLFRQLFPKVDPDVIIQAQQQIMVLMNETIGGSISKHDELQRLEAANRAASLEQALQQMENLSRQRGDLLRTSSHDLRSGLGLSMGAAYLLQTEDLSPQERQQFVDMLNRNLANVQSLLTGLMDLARLEAGHEPLQVEEFDAAQLLTELVTGVQPSATERNLILRADGPASLVVKMDRLKLYRIAQNLLVNALKYTPSSAERPGMISVSWSTENDWRWGFSVQDSGPGLPAGLLDQFHKQLKPVVEPTSVLSSDESQPVMAQPSQDHQLPPDLLADQSSASLRDKGEGVGLQIVKRLCELIGASLEIESISGRGTLFRVRMPVQSSQKAEAPK